MVRVPYGLKPLNYFKGGKKVSTGFQVGTKSTPLTTNGGKKVSTEFKVGTKSTPSTTK